MKLKELLKLIDDDTDIRTYQKCKFYAHDGTLYMDECQYDGRNQLAGLENCKVTGISGGADYHIVIYLEDQK